MAVAALVTVFGVVSVDTPADRADGLPPAVYAPPVVEVGPLPTVASVGVADGVPAVAVRGTAVQVSPTQPPPPETRSASAGLVRPVPAWSVWPKWRLSAEGVPSYGSHAACSPAQADVIADTFAAYGAAVETQWWAVYVASREAGCNYLAVNRSGLDDSHCFAQLNALNGPLSRTGYLTKLGWTVGSVKASFEACALAFAQLWSFCGKGPWIAGDYSCRRPTS